MRDIPAAAPLKGPRSYSPAGNLREFGRDPLGFLAETTEHYGDLVPLRFANVRILLVNQPEQVERILVSHNRAFRKPPAIRRLHSWIGNGLVSSDGDFWLRQRRLAQPAFHRRRIAAYGEVMVGRTDALVDTWRDGEVRDLHGEMMALTLEIASKVLFDTEVADEVRSVGESMSTLLLHYQRRLNSLLYFLPDSVPTPGNRRMWTAIRRLEALIDRIVAERRASGEDRGDLLSMLLAARDEDGSGMTDRQLRDEVMTLLLAGHETTALTLSWCWYLLTQSIDAESRLHAELGAALDGRPPVADDLPTLRYAEAVVYEALRLYPPAWLVGREAVEEVDLGPYCVRKGTVVIIAPWLLQRDPRYFTDPHEFRPERWLDGLARQLPRGAFLPFGAGPRMCIGAGFAMTEAVLLLARIAQRYRFRLEPGARVEPQPAGTLRPRGGVPMTLEAHRPAADVREISAPTTITSAGEMAALAP